LDLSLQPHRKSYETNNSAPVKLRTEFQKTEAARVFLLMKKLTDGTIEYKQNINVAFTDQEKAFDNRDDDDDDDDDGYSLSDVSFHS
jgi:hypothetical protein